MTHVQTYSIASSFTVCIAEHIAFDTAVEKNSFHRAHGYQMKYLLKVTGVLVSYLQPAQRDCTDETATHLLGGI